jgi:hypothetical protein
VDLGGFTKNPNMMLDQCPKVLHTAVSQHVGQKNSQDTAVADTIKRVHCLQKKYVFKGLGFAPNESAEKSPQQFGGNMTMGAVRTL